MSIFERLRVFVSSSMDELADERKIVKAALDALKVEAWVFEDDAGARTESARQTFLKEIEKDDLFIGLFWKGFGDYTIEEYEHARRKLGKDCLLYEKRIDLDGQRDPRLQTFLDRISQVESGHTIRWFNTPEELGEFVKEDVAAWQTRIVRERHTPRITLNLSLAEKKERNELLILVRKVKEFWVEGVLEHSVHGEALIDLGKEKWGEEEEHPWEQVLELPDQTTRTLPPGQLLGDLFDEVGRSLLILGAPGSGKTITLLDLARDLIARAETDPAQPIPVVFNLSAWTDARQPLFDWLIEELKIKYLIPKKIGRSWLEKNWLLPLLDGLDEVKRENWVACVEAVNAFVDEYGVQGLVVCSRLEEYTALPVRLELGAAICLLPLSQEQVEAYVAHAGEALSGLREALEQDEVLQALAETPLMLDVMTMAYRDVPKETLARHELNTKEARRGHLFDTYIAWMFVRKDKAEQPYAKAQTLGWLTWLARGMQQHGQTVFLIEQLQPSWLPMPEQRWLYTFTSRFLGGLVFVPIFGLIYGLIFRLSEGLIFGLNFGLSEGLFYWVILGLGAGFIDGSRFERRDIWKRLEKASNRWQVVINVIIYVLIFGLIFGLSGGLFDGLLGGLRDGLFFGLVIGLIWGIRGTRQSLTSDIQTVEALNWSLVHARKGCVIGVIAGLFFGLIFGLLDGLLGGLRAGLLGGLGAGLLGALFGSIFGGMRRSLIEIKTIPNQGIKLSIRNAVGGGGIVGLLVGLIVVVISGLGGGLSEALSKGLSYWLIYWLLGLLISLLIIGLIAALWYGGLDVIQHYTLRLFLHDIDYLPWKLVPFLDYATKLIFLRKVGGGYLFIHRYLLEHFAAMGEEGEEKSTTPASAQRPSMSS